MPDNPAPNVVDRLLARRRLARIGQWRAEVAAFRRESATWRDFLALMRVRLSQSKIGAFVTPRPIVVNVDLVTLGPRVRLRSHTSDVAVLTELLVGNSYGGLPEYAAARNVVDLGANIGLAFRSLRVRYPSARFVCVEPDAGNFDVLHANVRAVDAQADVVRACVGGRERQVKLVTTTGEFGFRMAEAADGDEDAVIDVITMNGLLSDAGMDSIDVLKCDIEGAEAELFADCRSWIDCVEHLVVECHTDTLTADALVGLLDANGARFEIVEIDPNPAFGCETITLRRLAAG